MGIKKEREMLCGNLQVCYSCCHLCAVSNPVCSAEYGGQRCVPAGVQYLEAGLASLHGSGLLCVSTASIQTTLPQL